MPVLPDTGGEHHRRFQTSFVCTHPHRRSELPLWVLAVSLHLALRPLPGMGGSSA